ncbi:SURF1-like protein [Elstera cyanobacteriorum]|uniref:SURF1-like protein n=1 Tax=Elstera cyanobacteriorum TaxID=2022747 RepID=A0A255XMF5_9PROT|nr:SURF1 family protein [Elstera cyanobacteriorum]OYQ18149.1 hypothetical protein CHR90_14430 [Elstera cyanobacteriorum]GFZ83385.1 SURF1-like protein [Elstera cyanobacteriorum]
MQGSSAVQLPKNWPLFLTAGIAVLILVALGTWQLQRLTWKQGLIEARRTAVADAPLTVAPTGDAAAVAFRRLRLTGRFDPQQEFYLTGQTYTDSRGMSQSGWHIIVPFHTSDGALVMVDRGFVPFDLKDPTHHEPPPQGTVTIDGLIRPPAAPGWLVPANDPVKNMWFTPDPAALAQAAGLSNALPFTLDLLPAPGPQQGWPRAGQTRLDLPNNHLQYALTWYSLAGVLIVVTGLFARSRRIGALTAHARDMQAKGQQ